MDAVRSCTVSESIKESQKEVKLMREGRIEKRSINDFWADFDKWDKE